MLTIVSNIIFPLSRVCAGLCGGSTSPGSHMRYILRFVDSHVHRPCKFSPITFLWGITKVLTFSPLHLLSLALLSSGRVFHCPKHFICQCTDLLNKGVNGPKAKMFCPSDIIGELISVYNIKMAIGGRDDDTDNWH